MPKGRWLIVPAAPAALSHKLRNKWSFHLFCTEHDFDVPRTELIAQKSLIDFEDVAGRLGLPVVFKPTSARGSQGVRLVRSKGECESAILENPGYQFAPLLAQQFIPGEDCGISLFANYGEILHCAIQTPVGDEIRFFDHAELFAAATRPIDATGYSGFMNMDARLRPDGGVTLLEINARTWETVRSATWSGLNFLRAAIEFTLGQTPTAPRFMFAGASPKLANGMIKAYLTGLLRGKRGSVEQKRLVGTLLVAKISRAVEEVKKALPFGRASEAKPVKSM